MVYIGDVKMEWPLYIYFCSFAPKFQTDIFKCIVKNVLRSQI